MGRSRKEKADAKSQTLPSSPSHHSFSSSSSSSDFEFTISLSPLKSSSNYLCPADELFYKGQLLPLHLSPRLSMVRTLLLSPSRRTSSSSATDSTTTSRDSTGSSNSNDSHSSFASELVLLAAECDSSRPSSVTDLEDEIKRVNNLSNYHHHDHHHDQINPINHQVKKPKYFSLSRISSVFRKDQTKNRDQENVAESSVKRTSSSAKDVIRKYLKKVKPLYEKLSQKQQPQQKMEIKSKVISSSEISSIKVDRESNSSVSNRVKENNGGFSQSFSGNLRYPRKRNCISSCPSSIRSSPNHSGVLCKSKVINGTSGVRSVYDSESSSMNELQNAIQGAIAHCKNSMIQNKEQTLMVELKEIKT